MTDPGHEPFLREAVRLALVWAAVTSILQVLLTLLLPGLMAKITWNGVDYRDQMMLWVRTGGGAEGNISLFLPVHLRHIVVFTALSLISGGLLGLVMGAGMLGYMNFYVGSLIAETQSAVTAVFLAWPVWAILRVVGFILAGTVLGAVLIDRRGDGAEKRKKILRFLYLAAALIVLDIVLKWALAPVYQGWLNSTLGG